MKWEAPLGKFDIFENSGSVFAVEWSDEKCLIMQSFSSNIRLWLSQDTLTRNKFPTVFVYPQDAVSRATLIQNIKQNSQSSIKYGFRNLNGGITYVCEELLSDTNGIVTSIFTDITETYQHNLEVSEVSERLELVLEGTRLGMWDWNPQTNDVVFDERWANMLGLRHCDLTQTLSDWENRVHPDDIEGCFTDIMAHVNGEVGFYENTHRVMHADGNWRYILDRGRVVKRDASGNPIRFTGTHTDVTELKKAELRAQESLSAKNKFFARMSHEIRTPLHGILGTADILTKKNLPSDAEHLVQIINDSGEQLQILLNDLLDVAKIEEDTLEISIKRCDIVKSLKTVFNLFKQKAESKGLEYTFVNNTPTASIFIHTDPSRINQIISNVISNSIKFTNNGFVKLTIDVVGGEFFVHVEDSGIGIKDTSLIFNPYTQEGTVASKSMGTGLGLSIVKSLCEKLTIQLHIDSVPKRGTCFRFNLGRVIKTATTAKKMNKAESQEKTGVSNKKVLVVDDNDINLLIAKTMLGECFEIVEIAQSGKTAIDLVSKHRNYDLIFMDLNMPEMDGIETSEKINQLNLANPPIIVAQTADATEEAKALLKTASIDNIITKPFTKEKLTALIHSLNIRARPS
ncbi:hybrid sensor histidine kinase/response regulator [Alteromonas hispanica]|uniref:histidine kinase n=1 Tax=Alteromonas hispanica TaxID=315421 RepID=A0A6L9MVD7_9ALTE|nr:PAS domain-containing hybrid sensor histidine kinase/response regulator [Alteromonas hispanica]NDW22162.1 response regulator [Alteromonas hispanica]